MNLARLRELLEAWQDGSIRTDELPEVIAAIERPSDVTNAAKTAVKYADRLSGFVPAEL